jgi:hypothetical protein
MISQHQIRYRSNLVSLGALVIDGLVDGADPATVFIARLSCPLGRRPFKDVSAKASLAFAVEKTKLFFVPAEL